MNNELYHFGVKGMHWGVRRYEDKNGHLTAAGKKRYDDSSQSRIAMDDAKRALDAHTAKFNKKYGKLDGTKDQYKNIESDTNKTLALNKAYKEAKRNYRSEQKRRNAKPALSKEDKRYDKLARKDAKEYARAKMFYGESAGNRRKLIKNTVAQRRKDNAHYNKVFDKYLAEQNMDKHVSAAKRERKVKNAANFGHRVAKKAFNAATSTPYILMSDNTGNELYHFGVRGMKWGQRRYQNQDGSYTAQGRGRYDPNGSSSSRSSRSSSGNNHARLKKAAKIGAGVAAAGLAAYGGYRLAKSGKLSGLSSGVKSAASRVRSSNAGKKVGSGARRVANKVGNTGVGKRVQRGVNSAQYHATRIKNEMAYKRATSGGRNVRSNVIGIGGPTYSRAGAASYRIRSAARSLASGAKKAPGAAKRVVKAPVNAHKKFTNWAFTNTGSRRRNFGRGLVYGGAHGLAFDAAVVGAAVHQGRKANKRYKNANSNKKRR